MIDARFVLETIKQEVSATWIVSSTIDRMVALAALSLFIMDVLSLRIFPMIVDACVVAYVWHTVRERLNG